MFCVVSEGLWFKMLSVVIEGLWFRFNVACCDRGFRVQVQCSGL
jgi:hypothetical protein